MLKLHHEHHQPSFHRKRQTTKNLRQARRQPAPAARDRRRASKRQKPGDHLPRPRCAWERWILPLDGLEFASQNYRNYQRIAARGRGRRCYELGSAWLGRTATAIWHAPLSILHVRTGHDVRFTRKHQAQRTHRHPHTAHHRPSGVDWKIWRAGYFAAQLVI